MKRPFLVVMAGGSASGKTTVAEGIAAQGDVLLISHDRYYRDAPDPASHNFDHPDALETTMLVEQVRELCAGRAVELPIYGFEGHRRAPHTERVEPRRIILVEGILTLQHAALAALADLRVYVSAAADIRLARRVLRDVAQRGRQLEGVVQRYLEHVRPMHDRFVAPARQTADLVLDGHTAPGALIAQLRDEIEARITA
ncbi:MAG: uridine kinase [Myxococcota bacterium]|nr:uridine kinase [Myxococcota bacterium]